MSPRPQALVLVFVLACASTRATTDPSHESDQGASTAARPADACLPFTELQERLARLAEGNEARFTALLAERKLERLTLRRSSSAPVPAGRSPGHTVQVAEWVDCGEQTKTEFVRTREGELYEVVRLQRSDSPIVYRACSCPDRPRSKGPRCGIPVHEVPGIYELPEGLTFAGTLQLPWDVEAATYTCD